MSRFVVAATALIVSSGLAFAADGRSLAAGLRYGELVIWNTADWNERLRFKGHAGDVFALAFTPDGQSIASGNGDWNQPGQIKFWNANTGELQQQLITDGEVLCLAISADGRTLVAGNMAKTLQKWNLAAVSDPKP